MSASSKKKLRNEQEAAKMTERQLAEQQEAKKMKLLTTAFVVVLAVIVVVAVWAGVTQFISNSGIREKNTVALTVGEHEVSNAELNYYYIDSINGFYNNYGSVASLIGLDLATPLDQQVTNEETGATWADDFLTQAKDNVTTMYALCDAANAAGYTLSDSELSKIDNVISNMQLNAILSGFEDVDSYLKAVYGQGASEESYRAYYEMNLLGESYYDAYYAGLTYDEAAIAEADAADPSAYNYYSYNYYNLNVSKFRTGGTTDDEGNTTYTEEETAAAVAAAKAAADSLVSAGVTTVEELDSAIAALEVNAEVENAASTAVSEVAFSSVLKVAQEWVTDSSRKVGDVTVLENATTSTDDEGNEVKTISGYYVVMFTGLQDNEYALKNVRHILAACEGGTYDETTGVTTYSDEEKAAAKAEADEILAKWQSGEATEDSFAELAVELSDDTGSILTGGLYEDIYPGQMVASFENWCFDESREIGDVDIVETEYGYHVMFFSGDSDTTYRQYMIEATLRSEDTSAWYAEIVDAMEVTEGNTKYIDTGLVLSSN